MGQEPPIRNNSQSQPINTYPPNRRNRMFIRESVSDATYETRRQYASIYHRPIERRPDDPHISLRDFFR